MKRVYTKSSDVIHLFAQRTQSNARCGNVFFESNGNKIYSYGYHYLLGQFLDDKTIFINDEGYSSTTSKHISELSYATRQYKQFYKTKADLESVYRQVGELEYKLSKARKPELYINQITDLYNSLNEFLKYKRIVTKTKKDKRYKYIEKVYNGVQGDSDAFREKLAKARKQEEEKERKRLEKELKVALQDFHKYKSNYFRLGDEDYLRLSQCGEFVETSQRVKVTVRDAKLLYTMIVNDRDIKGHRIGSYRVTSINGTLKIGCHNINMNSVHTVGKKLITK